jgi:hypothetical protein
MSDQLYKIHSLDTITSFCRKDFGQQQLSDDPPMTGQFQSADVAQPPTQGLVSPRCTITREKSPQSLCIRSASGHTPSHCSTEQMALRWFAQLQHAGLLLPRRSSHAAASWIRALAAPAKPIRQSVGLPCPRHLDFSMANAPRLVRRGEMLYVCKISQYAHSGKLCAR